MNRELISVVIPTYNRYKELIRALESVKNQTYKNLEVIIIDDNVDQKLSKKIEILIKNKYNNYIYIKNQENIGGALSRNKGIEIAKGKYISFLDDDDEYYPNKIEEQYKFFIEKKDEELALVYCYGDIYYPNGLKEKERTSSRGNCLVEQMKGNLAGTSFWMVRKDALIKSGCFKKIHSHQDGIVLLNLLANGYKIDLVEKDLVIYHFHAKGEGITDVNDKIVNADEEYYKLCRKYYNKIGKKEQKEVTLKYYNDRNWNLVILNRISDAKKDVKFLFKKFKFNKTLLICLYRINFRKHVCKKEKKFDNDILLGGKNER